MSTVVQHRGGTTAEHASFTGAAKEMTVDTDKNVLVVHDGVTAGGVPMAKEATVNAVDSKVNTEVTNRTNAVNAVDSKVNTEVTNRTNAVNAVANDLQTLSQTVAESTDFNYSVHSANVTASASDFIYADTSAGSFTVTLPASPVVGDTVVVQDIKSSFGTNSLIVAGNGTNIMGQADGLELNVNDITVEISFNGTDWRF